MTTLVAKLNHSSGNWSLNSEADEKNGDGLPMDVSIASQNLSSNIFGTFTSRGTMLKTPKLYNIFLGNWPGNSPRITNINKFTIDLVKSSVADVMKQYGYISGSLIGSAILGTTVNGISYRILNEPAVQLIIQNAIDKKLIPPPADPNLCYMIYLSDELSFSDAELGINCCTSTNNTAFGFHHFFKTTAGDTFIYSIMPPLTDKCIADTCLSSPTCAMNTTKQNQEERITQVASHEFAEMITNPTGRGWFDSVSGEEIGDVCNGGSAKVTVGNNVWNMQTEYSLTDDKNTSGRLSCVSSTVSTTPIDFYQRLTNDDIIKLMLAAGALMFISGLLFKIKNPNL